MTLLQKKKKKKEKNFGVVFWPKKKRKQQSPLYSSSLLLFLPLFFFSKRKRCCWGHIIIIIIIIIIMTPPPTKTAQHQGKQQQHPANKQKKKELVDLECDDEFEEFEEEGASRWFFLSSERIGSHHRQKTKGWDDERVVFENFFGVALLFSRALFRRASDRRTSLSLSTHIFTRTAEWTRENEEKEDVAQWEDDWDDTEADDFKTHLREELKKNVASRQRQQK